MDDLKTVHVSTDMQKVMLLPRIPGVKTCLFVRRLVVFHQAFAPIGATKQRIRHRRHQVLACVWHEAIAGRSTADMSSTYAKAQ